MNSLIPMESGDIILISVDKQQSIYNILYHNHEIGTLHNDSEIIVTLNDHVPYDQFIILCKFLHTIGKDIIINNMSYKLHYLPLLQQFMRTGTTSIFQIGFVPVYNNNIYQRLLINMIKGWNQGYNTTTSIVQYLKREMIHFPSIQTIFEITKWRFYTATNLYEVMLKDVDNFIPYVISGGKLLLFPSGRPLTNLHHLTSFPMLVISITDRINQFIIKGEMFPVQFGNEISFVIPISRYSQGINTGLYHNQPHTQSYCGTFYYVEPSSYTLLSMGSIDKILIRPNKLLMAEYMASNVQLSYNIRSLLQHQIDDVYEGIVYRVRSDELLNGQYDDAFIKDQFKIFNTTGVSSIFKFNHNYQVNGIYNNWIYSLEDYLDQPLCLAGKYLGFNVLIFSKMVGIHRFVEELLDTRSREISFKSLIQVIL